VPGLITITYIMGIDELFFTQVKKVWIFITEHKQNKIQGTSEAHLDNTRVRYLSVQNPGTIKCSG
jgi:hypothetical protein